MSREYRKMYARGVKQFVYQHIAEGKPIMCVYPGCKETRLETLSLDHVNNDGDEHRNNTNEHTSTHKILYSHYLKTGAFPDDIDLQIMCLDHNNSKPRTVIINNYYIFNNVPVEPITGTQLSLWEEE